MQNAHKTLFFREEALLKGTTPSNECTSVFQISAEIADKLPQALTQVLLRHPLLRSIFTQDRYIWNRRFWSNPALFFAKKAAVQLTELVPKASFGPQKPVCFFRIVQQNTQHYLLVTRVEAVIDDASLAVVMHDLDEYLSTSQFTMPRTDGLAIVASLRNVVSNGRVIRTPSYWRQLAKEFPPFHICTGTQLSDALSALQNTTALDSIHPCPYVRGIYFTLWLSYATTKQTKGTLGLVIRPNAGVVGSLSCFTMEPFTWDAPLSTADQVASLAKQFNTINMRALHEYDGLTTTLEYIGAPTFTKEANEIRALFEGKRFIKLDVWNPKPVATYTHFVEQGEVRRPKPSKLAMVELRLRKHTATVEWFGSEKPAPSQSAALSAAVQGLVKGGPSPRL